MATTNTMEGSSRPTLRHDGRFLAYFDGPTLCVVDAKTGIETGHLHPSEQPEKVPEGASRVYAVAYEDDQRLLWGSLLMAGFIAAFAFICLMVAVESTVRGEWRYVFLAGTFLGIFYFALRFLAKIASETQTKIYQTIGRRPSNNVDEAESKGVTQ